MIVIKNFENLRVMLKACEISAQALELAKKSVKPGMSTLELDKIVGDFIRSKNAKPSFLNYNGFKGNACVSVNEELIHGVPSKKKIIHDGDIVSVDVGAYIGGFHGDNAYTFAVGDIPAETKRLLEITERCLYEGIKMARVGNRIGDIGAAIQSCCEDNGFYIVRQYVGHGVGKNLHEDPSIPNFGAPGRGARLVAGMTIAIEPMINYSTAEVKILNDKWTVVEANGKPSAHFEHTIAVTDGDPLIMTLPRHEAV